MAKKKRKERGIELNQKALSETFGIDPRQIRRLMDDGVPHKKGNNRTVLFNSQDFFEWYVDREIKKRFGELERYRERLVKAQAEEKEISVQMLKGRIVEIDLLEDALYPVIHNAKTKLLSMPHAIAHRVATIKEVPKIEALLEERIYEALEELSYDRSKIVNKQISRRTGRDMEATTQNKNK